MEINRRSFEYQGKKLIDKVTLQPPYQKETVFQNQGCFLYMKQGEFAVYSSQDRLLIHQKEAVLLKCDTYFLELLKGNEAQEIEVIAFHLYPELLQKLYLHELPTIIEKRLSNTQTKHILDETVISKFIDSLEFYFENPILVNDDLLELKVKELILLLIQTKNIHSILELVSDLYSPRNVVFKNTIELHLFSNLSIEQLAKLSHMSISSFKREFQKIYNDTPTHYFNEKRIEKAKELLLLSPLPISDIAYDLGFNDPLYFTRLFKNKEGISPTMYRKQSFSY